MGKSVDLRDPIEQIKDEIQILQKVSVEHAGRITSLETQIIKKQNQTLLHIGAELEFIKQHPFDLVLIDGSIENISNIIDGKTEPIIDEGCVGCCKVVDVAAGLQKKLDERTEIIRELRSKIELVPDNFWAVMGRKNATIQKQSNTIEDLEVELSARKEDSRVLMKVVEIVKRDDNCPTIINQLADLLVDYLDAPEGPPETLIDEAPDITVTFAFLELP